MVAALSMTVLRVENDITLAMSTKYKERDTMDDIISSWRRL